MIRTLLAASLLCLGATAHAQTAAPQGMVANPCAGYPEIPASVTAYMKSVYAPGRTGPLPAFPAEAGPYRTATLEWAKTDWGNLCRYRADNDRLLAGPASGRQVVFMGDSITQSWPFADAALFTGGVVNRGISGQTTPQMVLRFMSDVVALKPKVVHIMAGTNDLAGNTGPSSAADYRNNISAMVTLAKANGITVILASIPPTAGFTWKPDVKPVQLAPLNAWLKAYAAREGLIFVDYHAILSTPEGALKPAFTYDGVHPNYEGYAAMAPLARAALAKALEALSMAATVYDAIIVGSGAGGGMAAYELTRRGLTVLMLEAGRNYDPVTETPMLQIPKDAPLRDAATPDKPFGFFDATVGGGWDVPGEPYTIAEGSEPFMWWRPRMLGGRTNHWARISLRFGPYDFKPYSRDGLGVDWPISYDDVSPWYDAVERLIGVVGGPAQGLENTPDSPPGCLQPVPPAKAYEHLVSRAFASMGIPTAPIRAAILTRPIGDRQACFYATACYRGCSIKANFQTPTVLLPPALATGKLTVRTDAMVYGVDLDAAGKASAVTFIDARTGDRHRARGRSVVLAAGACESARILLNSRNKHFRDGIGNDHGQVGRYLMDTVGARVAGQIPALEDLPPTNDDGIWVMHTYVPWWGYKAQADRKMGFARGYHIEMGGGRTMPSMALADILDPADTSRASDLRASLRRRFGSVIRFSARGEMIPNDDCYVDLDPRVTDKWGLPVLRFHWKWGEHEIKQAEHAVETFLEVIDRMGGKPIGKVERKGAKAISKGGSIIHEVGTTRMGDKPQTSVVNGWGQVWGVGNLFVMDGGTMASSPDKNPTLTILALAWRSSAWLADLAQRGEL